MTASAPPAADLFQSLRPSVVGVRARSGSGTGWVATANGLVVTNHHVVGYDAEVTLLTHDDAEVPARVVWVDSRLDVAFLQVLAPLDAPPLRLADSRLVAPGTPVVAIGHPLGLRYSLTRGIVSAVAREVHGVEYIQTDAGLNPGNSGGPLVDASGRAVAVSTWGYRQRAGLGFGVPVHSFYAALCEIAALSPEELSARRAVYTCHECRTALGAALQRCSACGARVAFREEWDALVSVAEVTAERAAWALLQELGFDPAICRVGPGSWRVVVEQRGELWVMTDDEGRFILVSTGVVKLPSPVSAAFLRFLLTVNDRTSGAARLELERDVVTMSLAEPVELLDVRSLGETVRDMLALAERLRGVLARAYGAVPAPFGLELRLSR